MKKLLILTILFGATTCLAVQDNCQIKVKSFYTTFDNQPGEFIQTLWSNHSLVFSYPNSPIGFCEKMMKAFCESQTISSEGITTYLYNVEARMTADDGSVSKLKMKNCGTGRLPYTGPLP